MDGVQLKELLARGDFRGACETLRHAYGDDVARFVRHRLPKGVAAEDVCQEIWLAVGGALPDFAFRASPRVWLFSVAHRKCADAHRQVDRREVLDSTLLDRTLSSVMGSGARRTPSREMHLEQRRHVLENALSQLTPDDREYVELRYVMGLKPAQIVELLELDCTPNSISQRIVRAVRQLRSQLESRSEMESYGARGG
jgi:RNA polymerase sigma-70 factor (ECF subfamily)